jgi:HPt (histidine-containing phosphotransfer) domain-containing protein
VERGINNVGGKAAEYKKFLAVFFRDAVSRFAFFEEFRPGGGMSLFVTHAHALKSALATMGAAELSAAAAELEAAGKNADNGTIAKKLPPFTRGLKNLCAAIGAALKTDHGAAGNAAPHTENTGAASAVAVGVKNSLTALRSALESKDMESIDRFMNELENISVDGKTRESFEKISNHILMGEYHSAVNALNSLFQGDT